MPSFLRLQDHTGTDVVKVNLSDGNVEVMDPDRLEEGAKIFWDTVAYVRHSLQKYKDFIIRGGADGPKTIFTVLDDVQVSRSGDILFQAGCAGNGGEGEDGGDVTVRNPSDLDEDTPPMVSHRDDDV